MSVFEVPLIEIESGLDHPKDAPVLPATSSGSGGKKPLQEEEKKNLETTPPRWKRPRRMKRLRSGAEIGLKGLRFLDKTGGKEGQGWKAVEKRFEQLAVAGWLPKENFGRCIGMGDTGEFAVQLFEALARRRGLDPDHGITKDDLKEFLTSPWYKNIRVI